MRAPESQAALFVADYSYRHNRRSACFLINEAMPKVWKQLPQARLVLVGRRLALTRELDPRIEVHGFVENLPGVYAAAGCALVPLLESRGSPLKLIEAMAYGLPVVATPFAAGGVDGLQSDVHYLEGDGAGRIRRGHRPRAQRQGLRCWRRGARAGRERVLDRGAGKVSRGVRATKRRKASATRPRSSTRLQA